MAAPFLDITEFQAEYQGTLAAGEIATATRLLQVVSDRIRQLKSDPDENAAKQVVFEVVRDAAMYGDLGPLSSFNNVTSRRTEAGTFDPEAKTIDDLITTRHKKMLGLGGARPSWYFGD